MGQSQRVEVSRNAYAAHLAPSKVLRQAESMSSLSVRPARPEDASIIALLVNGANEPHFHTTSERIIEAFNQRPEGRIVAEKSGQVVGTLSLSFPDFLPTHVWLGLSLHPDHRDHNTASALLQHASMVAVVQRRTLAWTSLRADYLSTAPDLSALGFREVHRTFGGGFYFDRQAASGIQVARQAVPEGITLTSATEWQHDPRLNALYHAVRGDKVTAEPTISAASDTLDDPDSLWEAAFVALRGEEVLGLALPERSGLGAWNAILIVHPDVRRQGIGTALQARVCTVLEEHGLTFLNTAGVKADTAYLGILRRLGANIEPDWIAFEAPLLEQA